MTNKKKCKSNNCLRYGIFENGICQKCIGLMNKTAKARKPIKKKSDLSYPKALKDAKTAFQLLRRLQESDENGFCVCVHGRRCYYTQCDGGHYIPSIYRFHCFNPLNVFPQEKIKNMDMMSPVTVLEYRNFLIKKIGLNEVEKLENTHKLPVKWSAWELIEMTKKYRSEIEILKKQKNILK